MAIPTQFSVTSTRTSPIANPLPAKDIPQALDAENVSIVDGAEVLSSLSSVAVDTPSTLAAVTGTPTTPPFALNHARILYDNQLESASVTSSAAGSNPTNAKVPNTWQKWSFTGATETIDFQFSVNTDIDTVCIGAHNLGNNNSIYRIYYSLNVTGDFILLTEAQVFDNTPIMYHRSGTVSARRIRVEFTGETAAKQAGYISAGIALQMQRPFFNGHTPITDADVTQYYSNRTESGEIIGQQIRRQGYETSAEWQNIDDTWYRTYFAPFKQAIKTKPFFFAWNLLEYPDDVGFCRISQDISAPMQNGTVTKRSISMNLLGAG